MPEHPSPVKCLVWDLDNTLWHGTLLEDDTVQVSEDVRRVIEVLDSRGILQSVSSRNDHDLAWQRLQELGLAEYFMFPQINWGAKSNAVRAVAGQLNFAHCAMAFIDDQPAERAEVSYQLPDVRTYRAEQVRSLPELPEFSLETVTVESAHRRRIYQAGFQREAEQETFAGPDEEFLRTLDTTMRISRATGEELSRVEEITLRTTRMNATGVHYCEARLRTLLADPGHELLVVTMADRYGPHGTVGVLLLETHPTVWHLKLSATSCRVTSFRAGEVVLEWLSDQAAQAGVHLVADFRPTERNQLMAGAYRSVGFTDDPCHCVGALGAPVDGEGIQRLHAHPARRDAPTTMRLTAPDLTTH
ncbi:methoxymalonate biosynthesis protein [Kitasatospora sp. MAA4]|uniref:HAD-IIIC family phosphatase n=1 Tax=Kitasatospora sp. MAA4 TaxID=3035093 RepID=UPI002475DE94|nr:HAD-IIIC family phosphatase [Kitasatospora sp. MAA4]MDH6132922.1 methoxymalonate biosynthesis protein [Kitasatospora sp. MAA4]